MASERTAPNYLLRPSRLFYFPDGDTIITCRDKSYRVHSTLLAEYSDVMRKALSMGRLPRLWKYLGNSNGRQGKSKRNDPASAGSAVGKRKFGGRARDIQYYISLDDNVQTLNLLFWCIYTCSGKPRITPENVSPLLHLSSCYTIPSFLPLCITFLESLALFHPLKAIPIIRTLLHNRKITPAGAQRLQSIYSEALSTILNDLPRYQEEQRENYTSILPDEIRAAFSDTWGRYTERVNLLRSGEAIFTRFTYKHSRKCVSEAQCEVDTREQLRRSWKELWGTCIRAVPKPYEVARFFMTTVRTEGGNDMCMTQVKQALGWILRGFGGEDAEWDWGFLTVEETSLRMAKELAIKSKASRGGRIHMSL